jgi:hypothetical protein
MITKAVPSRARTRTFAIGVEYITEHTHERAVATAGVTFEGGVAYASAPDKAAWIHLRGIAFVQTAAIEMEAVAALSRRCRDPVYHLIVAYAKHERPTREQVVSDAERLLKAIGMEDHQYVLAAHKDTDDFHAHVIANRVGSDGRANDLWHERIIRERVCAEIAAERGWDIVVGHHNRDIVQRVERLSTPPPDPVRRLSDGAYRRLHEHGELPWQDVARPYILDAVDRARDWSELRRHLAAHGVVVKLVQRGERVQGLAFAEGLDRTAPGCGASRIDARCTKAALEQRFGPFQREERQRQEPVREASSKGAAAPRNRGHLRERAERDARSDPDRALREAGAIVDHARMRSDYAGYRESFFAERGRAIGVHRNAAWEHERAQRQLEAQRRGEARRLLRAVVRLGTRGVVARQMAYWSVDAVLARRRAQEYAAARVRWEATKIVLDSERGRARKAKSLDYRAFVTEKARGGDPGAQRVLDMLAGQARGGHRAVSQRDLRRVNVDEVLVRLGAIRGEQEARYERARSERGRLQRVEQPRTLDDILAAERERIREQIGDTIRLTDAERARLAQATEKKRSWNPLARAVAAKTEAELQAAHRLRYEKAVAEGLREFEARDVPQLAKRIAADERRYRQYVAASLALEAEMRDARASLRSRIPQVEHRVSILERAGVLQVEIAPNLGLNELADAIEQRCRSLPEAVRREAERSIRREQRSRDRSRESMSIER